ncbi:MAG TPA: 50S ribosomal protein L5 [Candidatus Paceibacterota bacterium]
MTKTDFKKIDKIVVNTGIGRLSQQAGFSDKILPELVKEFAMIVGQKPQSREAKKSISGFKSREGQIIGLRATLHGKRASDFLTRIVHVTLPRVRDFRGVDLKNVDQNGNLNLGLREHVVFSEIQPELSKVSFGLQVTVVPRGVKNRESAIVFYRELGVPFKKTNL